jgi:hypothetical protein
MIVHQHEGVQANTELLHHLAQQLAEMRPIPIISENRPPLIASGGNVIPPASAFDP